MTAARLPNRYITLILVGGVIVACARSQFAIAAILGVAWVLLATCIDILTNRDALHPRVQSLSMTSQAQLAPYEKSLRSIEDFCLQAPEGSNVKILSNQALEDGKRVLAELVLLLERLDLSRRQALDSSSELLQAGVAERSRETSRAIQQATSLLDSIGAAIYPQVSKVANDGAERAFESELLKLKALDESLSELTQTLDS